MRKRDYQKEDKYEDTPKQVLNREARNRASYKLGKPGKDVAHVKPLSGGGTNAPKNLRVESVAKNRGWRGGQRGYKVPVDK
jgi:hypothetical protein